MSNQQPTTNSGLLTLTTIINRGRATPAGAAAIAALAVLSVAAPSLAQPISSHTFVATADSNSYTIQLIGGDPFSATPSATKLHAVLVPVVLKVVVGGGGLPAYYDPTALDGCDLITYTPATSRFLSSPLVQKSELYFNGVDVGKVQFSTGFKRAEFWNKPGGPLVDDTIVWTLGEPITLSASIPDGDVVQTTRHSLFLAPGPSCTQAALSKDYLVNYIKTTAIPNLQASGAITSSDFVFFLTNNVLQSGAVPASTDPDKCCESGGNHWGPQGWAWADYNSYDNLDIKSASHEIAEWTNTPAGNLTPSWGYIGEAAKKCVTDLQVGDPINTAPTVPIKLNGFTYHLAELAYFAWFYDGPYDTAKPGAGGVFSSNGTFTGPHINCVEGVTGGTYPLFK